MDGNEDGGTTFIIQLQDKMKKHLLLLLLFALSLHAIAQDPAREKIIQELAAHPQQDTFRVNRLNELSL